jgi:DNA topoisomerase-3
MRLFIAEKPDLAKAIVEGLGGGKREEGYYNCGDDYVTWCFGHMLQLQDPEDYDERYSKWNLDDLPIVHIPWKKKPGSDKKAQLKIIMGLLKQADIVVNAGDPDAEGQLLVDEILEYANYRLPAKRILINDNNTNIVRKALDNLRNNSEFAGLSAAAEARSVADQLYGYNLTRAYTLAAQKSGYQGVLSVGRVQTPILGMVVRRCRDFESHIKTYYYNVTAQFNINDINFPARYQIIESDPVDEKGRLIDESFAQNIADEIKGKEAILISVETKKKEQHPPLPYNLLKLQTDASRKFGLKPDEVKDITQSLREKHKLITYNRSDCEYLSDEQHSDAKDVLKAISETAFMLDTVVQRADVSIKSRAFNSSKVSAHHAIIPTAATVKWPALSEDEKKIYLLIARAYIAQFWSKHQYDQTDIIIEVSGHRFTVRANITTCPGWLTLYKKDVGNEDLENSEKNESEIAIDLRMLKNGERGVCTESQSTKMETKPQPLYTMATLLSDLTRVAKYIRDDRLRKLLQEKDKDKQGEHGGIGTPATRDSIITTLFDRNYVVEKSKNIISTTHGEELYDSLPDQAKYPDMTALWHEQQKAIQAGERDTESFLRELMEYISGEIQNVKQNGIGIKINTNPCPECKKPLRRIKGNKGYFWGCTGYQEGCKYSCDDNTGKPSQKITEKVSTLHKCMVCSKGLSRRKGKKKGSYWWGCSGYPECKQTYSDSKGKPDYSNRR